ncbi:Splicing factor [Coemansia sp. RSA 1939]|nr:Splicing factor [Coemansia sp. RSA 1939]
MSELPEKLEKTPYDYGTYIRWIELLRTIGDIESMRVARKTMSLRLAVPEDVWTEWIEDERHQNTGGISDAASISQIKELFDAATREYLSSSMWQKYVDFAKELSSSEDGSVHAAAGKVFGRDDPTLIVLEQAVSATHALYCGGQELWLQYMNRLKDRIDRAADIGSNQNELVDKLQSVFLERLDQPHAEIEETFNLYSEFVTKHFADNAYESQMVNASGVVGNTRVRCSRREALEESVVTSEGSWYAFSHYIDTISRGKQVDTREVSCLYERALLHNYCYPQVWDEYITFVACSSDESGDAVNVAGRAVRNCPWSGKLWAQLLSLTYTGHGYQSAASIYDNAVSTHALDHSSAVSRDGNETALSTTGIPATNHNTVFISNLPASYRETHVTELLGGIECVDKVELLSNKDGSFRGQAKACLRSTSALISALDKNGFRLENQHISIHIFKKHHQSARQEISVEVKGFSQETGNKRIEEIAKKTGGFIRIRRNRQGTIAYVVMKSMDDAVRAASALNGCEIDEHTLEAGISSADPTAEGAQEHRRTVPKAPSTSLVPRKVATPLRRPAKKLKIEKQDDADTSGLTMERGGISNKSSSKKSNDQFRQMYLNPNSKV